MYGTCYIAILDLQEGRNLLDKESESPRSTVESRKNPRPVTQSPGST